MRVIKENAIFIADSHYPHHGDAFLDILHKLKSGKIVSSQLFLMGDNFDLLFGHNDYIQTFSKEAIVLLQTLSQTMEIHYFEGNHDFCLGELFVDMHIYTREMQPAIFELDNKKVALSHGDKYATGFGYDFYSKILRAKLTLTLLKPLGKYIISHRMKKLSKKKICHTFYGFEKRVKEILMHYNNVDIVIEGHFHQSKVLDIPNNPTYISLPSQACQGTVAVVQEGEVIFTKL